MPLSWLGEGAVGTGTELAHPASLPVVVWHCHCPQVYSIVTAFALDTDAHTL